MLVFNVMEQSRSLVVDPVCRLTWYVDGTGWCCDVQAELTNVYLMPFHLLKMALFLPAGQKPVSYQYDPRLTGTNCSCAAPLMTAVALKVLGAIV